MRVVCPHVDVHPLTDRALRELVPEAERVYVGRTPLDYSRLLAELWRDRESFLVVEHDVELTPRALRQALHCTCWWSASPYKGQGVTHREAGILVQSLGCTRFRRQLMEAVPHAIDRANSVDDVGPSCPPGHWKMLDGRILGSLGMEGYKPHQHCEVPHHHRYDYGCACGAQH